jgi:hypothetical protein
MSYQRFSDKSFIFINYYNNNNYEQLFIRFYRPLTSSVWTFLTEQHKTNNGCIVYGIIDNIKKNEEELNNTINIKRNKTYRDLKILFENPSKN